MPEAGESPEDSALRPFNIPWYPNELAWSSLAGRRQMKEIPFLDKYRQFIVAEHDKGNINRQESVSMIPALFLDVQPHHVVLDMCAAPGSKTAQLLEALQSAAAPHAHASGLVSELP